MNHLHTAVWIDHHEAKIFHLDAEAVDVAEIMAPSHHVKRHPSRTADVAHPSDAKHFHRDVALALADSQTVLVLGPSNAKLELVSDWKREDPKTASKVVAVETVDHPTDGQIVAYARKYFKGADHMHGNV